MQSSSQEHQLVTSWKAPCCVLDACKARLGESHADQLAVCYPGKVELFGPCNENVLRGYTELHAYESLERLFTVDLPGKLCELYYALLSECSFRLPLTGCLTSS
jgi:hypothetical protein